MNDVRPQLYRLDLAYQGSGFSGWQSQSSGQTVQDHLEQALATFLRHPVRVTGASRTDTGVHAQHQVATFRTSVSFTPERWLRALEHLLPPSVGVKALVPVAEDFHPGLSARGKVYLYRIWRGAAIDPFTRPYVWRMHGVELDLGLFIAEAAAFVGRHDFSAFCAADSTARTRERTIYAIEIEEHGPELRIWFAGHGFLKQQIRIMTGTLVDVAKGRRPPGTAQHCLANKERAEAGKTAPAQGLSLMQIVYDEDVLTSLATLRQRGWLR